MSFKNRPKHSSAYLNYLRSPAWKKKSAWVRSLTKPWWLPRSVSGRCCLFPWLRAKETHHLTYYFILNLGWNWFGFEQPCWHLIPLSKPAHKFVSQPAIWQQPVRFLMNTYLRLSFLVLWTICKPLWSVPFWCVFIWSSFYLISITNEKLTLNF
jgi:hypothetical protein